MGRVVVLVGALCIALILGAPAWAAQAVVRADDGDVGDESDRATYAIEIPKSVALLTTTSIPFTVTAPTPICSVHAQGAGAVTGSGPYSLTIDPAAFQPTDPVQIVRIVATTCDGLGFYDEVMVSTPFVVNTPSIVSPWGERRSERVLTIGVLASPEVPVTLAVLHKGELYRNLGSVTQREEFKVAIPKDRASGPWAVQVRSPVGDRLQEFTVARQWAPLLDEDSRLARFPACSTVTWAYEPTGQPTQVPALRGDISRALQRMGKITGLRFTEVDKEADLTFDWGDLGPGPIDAVGGGSWQDSGYQAGVTLNVRSQWVRHPGFRRVPSLGGLPARGNLLMHEVGHALGLGHVDDRSQIMYPFASSRTPVSLAKGDRAGLRYLYSPQSCS